VRVTDGLWRLFESPGVALATSYYSPAAEQHDAVTGRRSHDRTLASIRRALARGIPLRVGVVSVRPGQQVDAAVGQLRALGVADVGVDHLRQVGRGVRDAAPDIAQLCGGCADHSLAVSPVGDAWPCVVSRWLRVGNVREEPLEAVNARAGEVRRELAAAFAERRDGRRCGPDGDGGLCRPVCMPVLGCRPFRATP
jgi:MoaA/NifB/PqqE/SkfB family radical SAM enzyme